MRYDFLHNHKDFPNLIQIVADEYAINPVLIEKDYWIMHCLYGLQQLGLNFELKGGTSLSKGFGIIDRFSEDIDIRIEPPTTMGVKTNPNQQKPAQVETRESFYDWLASMIKISGINGVERDTEFDDKRYYRSGGIRLQYDGTTGTISGLKNGILLEVGFDDVSPNSPQMISSWVYGYAADKVAIIDNRAIDVACYHPGYTFVEKLQTISTKFRRQQEDGNFPANFMRHYYDVYQLLNEPEVCAFIGTKEYAAHKAKRFSNADNPILAKNEAFLLNDPDTRQFYAKAYAQSHALYYKNQPSFDDIMAAIVNAVQMNGI
ncbi:MAG: hypothetical protein COA52_11580 [Hyphomicrobiales bacterium]|nr:MAG: hypothetical protein COA52_11580 [Hyphomicrobiales bacterium]